MNRHIAARAAPFDSEKVCEAMPRGKVLTLSGLQFSVDAAIIRYARKAGVRQRVEFPRLEGSFSPSQPMFLAVAGGS